ncbi:MAG: metallophosphoesterase family protein [Hyphomicrobiaceae bacterium]
MRLQIFSDVHVDFAPGFVPRLADDVDAVVIAGDICEGIENGMRWLRAHLGHQVPIVLVAGNHEYFARIRAEERLKGARAAGAHGITYLDDTTATIGPVRFVGSTLWADYAIYGASRRGEMIEVARRKMMDHRRILEAPGRFITPEECLALHGEARDFLEATLASPHDGPTVVVTHNGPHPLSLVDKFRENLSSAAFISDLSAMIDRHQPALWVHGHTHVSLDYRVGKTRIVCNPHGYGDENPGFDAGLIVEV